MSIWEEREHISELSGKPLLPYGHIQWHWQFLHILPKGSYPKWKFEKKNIILALPEEHERQNEYEAFNEKYNELRQEYYKIFYGKRFGDDNP
jgi:hypothetical protein